MWRGCKPSQGVCSMTTARETYKQALKLKPNYAETHNNMGTALKDNGDPDAATDSFRRAIKIKPLCLGVQSRNLVDRI